MGTAIEVIKSPVSFRYCVVRHAQALYWDPPTQMYLHLRWEQLELKPSPTNQLRVVKIICLPLNCLKWCFVTSIMLVNS
jgi:hypothetical protein